MKKKFFIGLLLAAAMMVFAQDNTEPKNLLHLDDESFDNAAKNSVLIVDFYADWCGPCRMFAPTFVETAADLPDYTFAKVNVDKSRMLSVRYDIQFIPFIVAIKDGKVISKYNYNRGTNKTNFSKWVKSIK